MKSIIRILKLFEPRERRQLIPLTAAVLLMSVLEVIGIGSLAPFMAVVTDPAVITEQPVLQWAYEIGGFTSERGFLIALGVLVFVMVFLATAVKIVTLWALYRYIGERRFTLGYRLFRQYLYQPYSYYQDHNTSELSKNLLTEVDLVINGVLRPAVDTFAKGALAIAILVFLILANPVVAIGAGSLFGVFYLALYSFVRPRLARYGSTVRAANAQRFKAAGEAFGAIKDVKILGKEAAFSRSYAGGARDFARAQASNQILSSLPVYAMHAIAIGFAVGLVIVMLTIQDSLVNVLPLVAIYGFAVQRLMPNLQAVFQGTSHIRYYAHTVDALYRDMTSMPDPPPEGGDDLSPGEPLRFDRQLHVDHLSFAYPTSPGPVLSDIDVTVPRNATVAFVGTTGCGKTTLVDLMMGLLEPTAGTVRADDTDVFDERVLARWQRNFGYVPQQIYLSDDTVSANIALGIPPDERDPAAIERAARIANLHDWVTGDLPDGYDTVVGERGIKFSGGQRQRVGIARALYHDPDILVMDEATSALDSVTEDAVMDAIHALMHSKTIILIAHRITTVRECDVIYLMERGRIVDSGGYEELLHRNAQFRALAKVDDR